jgi:hypothetical protein
LIAKISFGFLRSVSHTQQAVRTLIELPEDLDLLLVLFHSSLGGRHGGRLFCFACVVGEKDETLFRVRKKRHIDLFFSLLPGSLGLGRPLKG